MTEVLKRQSGTVAPEITEPPTENSMSPGVVQTNTEPPSKRPKVTEVAGVESNNTYEAKNNMGGKSSSDNNGQPPASNGAEKNGTGEKLDHNLYSRQIYALGESAMQHLRKSAVLISGLGGTGVETAKNLILGGVRHVTIHDTKEATWHDLSSQFYMTEADLGKNRAAASFERLAELNDSVQCTLHTEPLTEAFVSQFDLIVLTEAPHSEQLRINEWTRQHGKQLIVADARGLFAYIFVDLGERFRIDDANGEQSREVIIEHINRETGEVFTLEKVMHGFEDDDHVTFSEVQGMPEINDHDPIPIKVTKPNVFTIGEVARNFSEYKEGGRARQAKVPKYVNFKSLAESLKNPDYLVWDFAKFEAPAQLHALWQALYKFEEKYKRSPNVRSVEDVALLKAELPAGTEEIPEKLLQQFSFQATGNLQPITSTVGGIAAQEAMKAVTHHTTPLQQYLYVDSREALPGDWTQFDNDKLTAEDCKPRGSRYDGQAAVFGWPYQEALLKQKWFVVGAGAIGCELLKNMAMMGIGCDPNGAGKVKITDMDTIEVSNLNRQFLFRRPDVGGKKSEVAARAVKKFNKDMNVVALSERVSEDTEHIFNDAFFTELNGVANALDNVDARRYMDRRCVYYQLPLLESGTLGSKGNTQVVYPHLTESYSSSTDPPEKDIPICTLKNFPYEISHTIQWARDLFEKLFTSPAETVNQYLTDERTFLDRLTTVGAGQRIEMLRTIKQALMDEKPSSPEECVKWARETFQSYYHNQIAQLLHNFPADQVTDHGVRFWSGTKRCPHPLEFTSTEGFHFDFVYAASILRAQQYNLEPITDKEKIVALLKTYAPKPFVPQSGVRIAVTDAEAQNEEQHGAEDSESLVDELKLALARLNIRGTKKLQPIDFEKDDDANHHVEFVTAASNLRAENYEIPQADFFKTKQIAGRIIPALATTTAVVAGLVCVELYKIVDAAGRANAPLDRFKNGFINLALPFYAFSEPIAAPKKKYAKGEFTLWDRLEVSGPKTLKELIGWVEDKTGHQVSMVSSGVSLIYAFFQPPNKVAERMGQDARKVVEDVSRKPIPEYRSSVVFEVVATDDKDEDVEVPYIKYNLA